MTLSTGADEGMGGEDLADVLPSLISGSHAAALTSTILALAEACAVIAELLGRGPLAGQLGAGTDKAESGGDQQKHLDVLSNNAVLKALAATPTAYFASEEEDEIVTVHADGVVAVAVDPLDGSSNIDVNGAVGTIFSIFPASPRGGEASFFRSGREQLAAGYVVYGPHTDLVFTTGSGVHLFVMDPGTRRFQRASADLAVPHRSREFAINASNYRHWFEPVRIYFDECLAGAEGPRGVDFNMRWPAAMVVDAHRILTRGGVYIYPSDQRRGYEQGRLRLIYEAFPIAMLMEQSGGAATDGHGPILDKVGQALHERTPLVFGSAAEVAAVTDHHRRPASRVAASPLFGHRGLFRR